MWKEYTNALLGFGVAIVAFLGLTGTALIWTPAVLGALILILGLWSEGLWQDYTNAVLGLGVIIAAFLGLSAPTLIWTLGLLGAAVVVLSLWDVVLMSSPEFKHTHA